MDAISFATKTLSEASKEVPALKYATALTGVAAALALVAFFTGKIENPIPLIGLVIVGMVVLFIFSIAVSKGVPGGIYIAAVFVWSVIVFFITFLGFTIFAYGMGLPCNWAGMLGAPPHTSCGPRPWEKPRPEPEIQLESDQPAVFPELAETKTSSFSYIASEPGNPKRVWERVAPDRWREKTNGKTVAFLSVVKRINHDGCDGTVVSKSSDKTLELFIPDRNCEIMQLSFRRSPSHTWIGLPPMEEVK